MLSVVTNPDHVTQWWAAIGTLLAAILIGVILVEIKNWREHRRAHQRWREQEAAKAGVPLSALPRTKGGRHLRSRR
jgi:endonuclease III-like uncharacterized protein